MRVEIPLLVEQADNLHFVRPLFARDPVSCSRLLRRAVNQVTGELRRLLTAKERELDHDDLARRLFAPDLRTKQLDLQLELSRQTLRGKFLFVVFNARPGRVAFTPAVPDEWFLLRRGEDLKERATETLTAWLRRMQHRRPSFEPDSILPRRKTWVTTTELELRLHARIQAKPERPRFLLMGSSGPLDGAAELESVGRCLSRLSLDELEPALLREREVTELDDVLSGRERRAVALVGPPKAGKTAIVHERLRRRLLASDNRDRGMNRRRTWFLSPPRLISGMSYVGQWEERLMAILDHARKRRDVLYVDDPLGLYLAGVSAESQLSVGDVLRPHVERGELFLLLEMTENELAVLRERDRGLVDQLHVIRVREPELDDVHRMLVQVIQQLEDEHRCRFAPDVLPLVVDLCRRYLRQQAFPGKAASLLRPLALRSRREDVDRDRVLSEFQRSSGLTVGFLDTRERSKRRDIEESLERDLLGQPEAVAALTDALSIARARLDDPGRPLASLLFLGPTGVGKTQAAKALARHLFGDPDRMHRFDMNELIGFDAVDRLIGTFHQPEGLLTSAVQRQPFAVVLLDEIEKAAAPVFDLLLQLLEDGRLTDARGRTADFTNCIVVLTSNLGAREASSSLGFDSENTDRSLTYRRAAERFFRPELFNRLDRLVPFRSLDRETVAQVARRRIDDVFQRPGLRRRRTLLEVHPRALELVIDAAFDPSLGARALKRAVEQRIASPLAERLAGISRAQPTLVRVLAAGKELQVQVDALSPAKPLVSSPELVDWSNGHRVLDRLEKALASLEGTIAPLRPEGTFSSEDIGPAQEAYFLVRDELARLRRLADGLREAVIASRSRRVDAQRTPVTTRGRLHVPEGAPEDLVMALFKAPDPRVFLRQLVTTSPQSLTLEGRLQQLARAVAALRDDVAHVRRDDGDAVLALRAIGSPSESLLTLRDRLADSLSQAFDLEPETFAIDAEHPAIALRGWRALRSARKEEGTHVVLDANGTLTLIQVVVRPLGDETPRRLVESLRSAATRSEEENPFALAPLLRFHDPAGACLDVVSGLAVRSGFPDAGDLRRLHAARHSWPDELPRLSNAEAPSPEETS
ncbi:MAG: AAA family ATPase [Acidobacteriota bacterium]